MEQNFGVTFLRVKIKHLATEPAIIKQEAQKVRYQHWRWRHRAAAKVFRESTWTKGGVSLRTVLSGERARARFNEIAKSNPPEPFTQDPWLAVRLRHHHIHEARPEARAALLAYGFIRGRAYHQIERDAKTAPNWDRVGDLVRKFGSAGMQSLDKAMVKEALLVWRDAVALGLEKSAA